MPVLEIVEARFRLEGTQHFPARIVEKHHDRIEPALRQRKVGVGKDDAKQQQGIGIFHESRDRGIAGRTEVGAVYDIGRIKWSDNSAVRAFFSDYTLSSIVQWQSGSPYSALVGNDPNNDGNRANDRLPGTVRNQFTTPSVFQLDARVTRNISFNESMRVRLILEAFNVFNHPNVVTINNTFFNLTGIVLTSPSALTAFGTPRTFSSPASGTTTFATPRQLQLAVKFDF